MRITMIFTPLKKVALLLGFIPIAVVFAVFPIIMLTMLTGNVLWDILLVITGFSGYIFSFVFCRYVEKEFNPRKLLDEVRMLDGE